MRKDEVDSGRGLPSGFQPKSLSPAFEGNSVMKALVSGSISSVVTTVIYQPLELIKTRIQIQDNKAIESQSRLLGRATKSAINLAKIHGPLYLWRGTAAVSSSQPNLSLHERPEKFTDD